MTRRQAIQRVSFVSAACAVDLGLSRLQAQPAASPPAPASAGPYTLAPLPYPADALEPHIDARTMEIHHDKHHAAYVQGLNRAVADYPALAGKPVEALVKDLGSVPEKIRAAVRNHGGGHANHSLFWQLLRRNQGGQPAGEVAKAIDTRFGSYSNFQQEFTKAALGVFGSGWAWLTIEGKELRLETSPNQDTPLSQGRTPILGLDVWEHAYYLKYQNRRADYIAAFYQVIHWEFVDGLYRAATA
jgi:superoxide dismutase, Fe-Mn family